MQRQHLQKVGGEGGAYFRAPPSVSFISTGCTLLDCVLAGGWAEHRIANIVGDKSTGKTLLAIEAAANFIHKYPDSRVWYNEVESAFDIPYAEVLGLPVSRVHFIEGCDTVEDFFEDLTKCIFKAERRGKPVLYILDSLDALSDRDEQKRKMGEGTYGTAKAKLMSQLFRRLVRRLKTSLVTVIIISQVRANIGVTFGRNTTRTGGKALDFYASQILYLSQMGVIKKTRRGVERAVGVRIRARCDKNKAGLPYRECEFPILFSYGVDDVVAGLKWLIETKQPWPLSGTPKQILKQLHEMDDSDYMKTKRSVAKIVKGLWDEIEREFMPRRSKYARREA